MRFIRTVAWAQGALTTVCSMKSCLRSPSSMPQKNRVRFAQSSQKLYLKLSKEDEYRQLVGRWLDQKHLEEALMVSYLRRALGLDAHDALEKAREKEASDISKIEEARRMRAHHYLPE